MRASLTGMPRIHRSSRQPAVRLDYVDGLRAIAVLAIVVMHGFQIYGLGLDAYQLEGAVGSESGALYLIYENAIEVFRYAVQVFVVLSGFSLMLSVVRRDGHLSGGFVRFGLRRARRILPPYYAALGLSLLAIALVPGMNAKTGGYWDVALPALELKPILAHALLVHNQMGDPLAINPPLWSMAAGVQIIALFPLLALVWRSAGTVGLLAAAAAFSFIMTPVFQDYGLAYPFYNWWFVVLFALGMAAASIAYSHNRGERRLRERLPWFWMAVGAAALFGGVKLLGIGGNPSSPRYLYEISLLETTIGLSVMCLLVALSRQAASKRLSLAKAVGNPLLVSVGHISYSLFLIHAPVLALIALGCRVLSLPRAASFPVIVIFGSLLAIGLAYLFHLAFERPFMSSAARKAVAPAPPAPPPGTVAAN